MPSAPRGPRYQVVAYLGELHPSEKAGWAHVARIVNHRPEPCLPLFGTASSAEPVPEVDRGDVTGFLKVTWTKHEDWRQWAQVREGWYLLRTNLTDWSPKALWKTLEQWMARCGLGNGPRPVIEEFDRIKTNDVILPTSVGRRIRIRCVTRPDESQRILMSRLGLTLPARLGEPKWETPISNCSQDS